MLVLFSLPVDATKVLVPERSFLPSTLRASDDTPADRCKGSASSQIDRAGTLYQGQRQFIVVENYRFWPTKGDIRTKTYAEVQ